MPTRFRPRHEHLYWLFPLLLGLGLAYAATGFFLPAPSLPDLGLGETQTVADSPEADLKKAVFDKNILNLDKPKPAATAVTKTPPAPKVTPANWRVAGVVQGERSMALIEEGGNMRFLWRGMKLKGWLLAEVREKSVVWTMGDEEVEVPVTGGATKASVTTSKVKPRQVAPAAQAQSHRLTLKKDEVADVLKDPSQLLSEALFRPHRENGEVVGFKIRNIKKNSLLRRAGLRSGDVLMRINGREVNGPKALMEVYETLGRATSVSIEGKRGASPLSFIVEIQ